MNALTLSAPISGSASAQAIRINDNGRNILGRAFSDVLDHSPLEDRHPYARNLLKAGAVTVIGASLIPYEPVFYSLPNWPLLFTAASISYYFLDLWSSFDNIKEFLGPKSKHEYELIEEQEKDKKCYLYSVTSAAFGLAITSQIPSALPVLDYFKSFYGLDLRWPGFLCTVLETSLVTMRSCKMTIDAGFSWLKRRREVGEEEIAFFRQEFISLIEQNEEYFTQLGWDEKLKYLEEVHDDNPYSFFSKIKTASSRFHPSAPSSLTRRVALVFQNVLTPLSLGLSFWYSMTKMKENVIGNNSAAIIISLVAVALNTKVLGNTIYSAAERTTNFARDLFKCREKKTIAEQLKRKLALSSKVVGLFCNLLTLSSSFVIWRDFGRGQKLGPPPQNFFTFAQCAATFGMLFTATMDTIDDCILSLTRAYGTQDEKQVVQFRDDCQRIKQMINLASNGLFNDFLNQAPAGFKSQFVQQVKKASAQIEQLECKNQDVELGVLTVAVMPAASAT